MTYLCVRNKDNIASMMYGHSFMFCFVHWDISSRNLYVGVLISLWLFLFAAQPRIFLGWVKEVRTTKSLAWSSAGIRKYIFNPVAYCFPYKAKDLSVPSSYLGYILNGSLCYINSFCQRCVFYPVTPIHADEVFLPGD
jgi:hypothetical protein